MIFYSGKKFGSDLNVEFDALFQTPNVQWTSKFPPKITTNRIGHTVKFYTTSKSRKRSVNTQLKLEMFNQRLIH